jgi:hypothetical protein
MINTQFPAAPERYTPAWANNLTQALRRYLSLAVSQEEETPRIVLRAPNGKLYDLTVDNAGALVVTATEKQRA